MLLDDQRSEYQKLLEDSTPEEFELFINSLSEVEVIDLYYDLAWQGRPKQQLPDGQWSNWLILSGRGFGKTWVGAKVINHWARSTANIALIGDNIGEVRDVMIDGPSGILKMARPDFNPSKGWNKTTSTLTYPNGCKVQGYSAQDPESLRGPNNGKAWLDELFKWRYQMEVWDELQMTMRSGDDPQSIITSTPRTTKLCKQLAADEIRRLKDGRTVGSTIITRGSTYENYALNAKFLTETVKKYEGTRRGRQELYGEILEDNPGALFRQENFDQNRLAEIYTDANDRIVTWLSQMDRIVVAVDPATTSNEETSDATGLVVLGRKGERGYVFRDETFIGTPSAWGKKAVDLYHNYEADRVIAEVNQGGDMVETIIRNIDANISYKKVHATRGKAIRAEPIAALYEQNRISHVGDARDLAPLEDEMTSFDPALGKNQKSPNRMDAVIWGFTELFGEGKPKAQIFFL